MLSWPGICTHLPEASNLRPWYMQRTQSPSRRPLESFAPRCAQRLSSATTLPLSPRKITVGCSRIVRGSSLPSASSWSQAATYQQFFRKSIWPSSAFRLPALDAVAVGRHALAPVRLHDLADLALFLPDNVVGVATAHDI